MRVPALYSLRCVFVIVLSPRRTRLPLGARVLGRSPASEKCRAGATAWQSHSVCQPQVAFPVECLRCGNRGIDLLPARVQFAAEQSQVMNQPSERSKTAGGALPGRVRFSGQRSRWAALGTGRVFQGPVPLPGERLNGAWSLIEQVPIGERYRCSAVFPTKLAPARARGAWRAQPVLHHLGLAQPPSRVRSPWLHLWLTDPVQ